MNLIIESEKAMKNIIIAVLIALFLIIFDIGNTKYNEIKKEKEILERKYDEIYYMFQEMMKCE